MALIPGTTEQVNVEFVDGTCDQFTGRPVPVRDIYDKIMVAVFEHVRHEVWSASLANGPTGFPGTRVRSVNWMQGKGVGRHEKRADRISGQSEQDGYGNTVLTLYVRCNA